MFGLAQDGTEPVVKEVLPGDSVHSLLSILDIITVSLSLSLSVTPRHRHCPLSSTLTLSCPVRLELLHFPIVSGPPLFL